MEEGQRIKDIFERYSGWKEGLDAQNREGMSDLQYNILTTQYGILFRQWKELDLQVLMGLGSEFMYRPVLTAHGMEWQPCQLPLFTCLAWNWGYFKKYFLAQNTPSEILDALESACQGGEELTYYSQIVLETQNVFELFFCNCQPLLGVTYFKGQELAKEHLEIVPFNLIFDEVGTGKTVSALYCIQSVLSKKTFQGKILILCPYNKKAEWKRDLERQMGRYVHVVETSHPDFMYHKGMKECFFQNNEPCIFIQGQKTTELKESLYQWEENGHPWDLVVIDEGHLCFENYDKLRSDKAILLTATPIVPRSITADGVAKVKELRDFEDYVGLLHRITGEKAKVPLALPNLFEKNVLFTQLFREDLGLTSTERSISFAHCKRMPGRQDYLEELGRIKGGMTKLLYEQDDDFLKYAFMEHFREDMKAEGISFSESDFEFSPEGGKFHVLSEILRNNPEKSYIIFFNCIYPANQVYKKLVCMHSQLQQDCSTILGKKYGGKEFDQFPPDNSVTNENFLAI